jgi:predicted nucleotide-binding protein
MKFFRNIFKKERNKKKIPSLTISGKYLLSNIDETSLKERKTKLLESLIHQGYMITRGGWIGIPHDPLDSNIIHFHQSELTLEFLHVTFRDKFYSWLINQPAYNLAHFRKISLIRDDVPLELSVRFIPEDSQNSNGKKKVTVDISVTPAIDLKIRQQVKDFDTIDYNNLSFFYAPSIEQAKDIGAILEGSEIQPPRITEQYPEKFEYDLNNRKVFIVHGHDSSLKNDIEKYLRSLDLDPIILHKQADLGKTIIEKVEHYSDDVGFAVILLTKDDFGGIPPKADDYNELQKFALQSSTGCVPSLTTDTQAYRELEKFIKEIFTGLNPRARQNVIFEFGYFIGRVGRNRVAALCEEGIERPSDIDGLLFTLIDNKGEWRKKLAKEIDAAGIEIDEKFLE